MVCRTPRPKHDLVRIVRRPDGPLVVDGTGRLSGRGAYLCTGAECWAVAARKGPIEHVLKVPSSPELRELLAAGPTGPAPTTEPLRAAPGSPDTRHPTNSEGGARGQK